MADRGMGRPPYGLLGYFLKPYWRWYGLIAVVMCAASCFESLSLAAFFPVFHAVLDPAGPSAGGLMGWIAERAYSLPLRDPVMGAIALLAGLMVCKTALILVREVLVAQTSGRVLRDLEDRMLTHYAAAPYTYLVGQKQGELTFDCLMAPVGVSMLVRKVPQGLAELLKVLAIVVVLGLAAPWITGTLALIAVGVMGLVHAISRRVAYSSGTARADASAEQMSLVNEFLVGKRQISAYGTTAFWVSRFRDLTRRYAQLLTRYLVWLSIPRAVVESAIVLLLLGLIGTMRFVSPSQLTANLPILGLFAVGLFQLLPSLSTLGRLRMEIDEALPSAERIHKVLTMRLDARWEGRRRFEGLSDGIVFERVSFGYGGRPPLLSGVDLRLRRGTVTALVGPSGAGKTTLVNLLLGLCEPTDGRILVDGVPLREYDLNAWRGRLGFVGQEPFIFHASVEDNIRFGRQGYSDAQVVEAAKIAHAHPFISELPRRYQTVVGERGAKLSGGQQQRIAIARAVLGNPELLILDEAMSALDRASERIVRQAITEASRDRTVVMVTHGMAMAMGADQIAILDGGRIVQTSSQAPGEQAEALGTLLTRSYEQP